MTKEADNEAFVRLVQERFGLNVDGWAGQATRAAFDAKFPAVVEPVSAAFTGQITERMALELIGHEAIVQEAYKDSVGVWTWGVGVTSASGHVVERYQDNPQTIARCLEVYLWLLREKYLPDVLAAFSGYDLTEAEAAAALSFHYNTGAIKRAGWVKKVLAGGSVADMQASFMEWRNPPEIVERRRKECDLFFSGKWSSDGKTTVWPVKKPSYRPDWGNGKRVDITADLRAAMSAGG
jgi:lysozyme